MGQGSAPRDGVYGLAKKMKQLNARDLSLFTLTDFVQMREPADGNGIVAE